MPKKIELRRKVDNVFDEVIQVRSEWSIVDDKPTEFPPESHSHGIADLTTSGTASETTYLRGDGEWVTLATTIALDDAAGDGIGWDSDSNTYYVEKATTIQAEAGINDTYFMTPLKTAQAIDELAPIKQEDLTDYQTHIDTVSGNPHNVTKADVGLNNVDNYSPANQAEAEAGTSLERYMTPKRVKQAILALTPDPDFTDINAHIADGDIHFLKTDVSKTDVGLANVENYGIANQADAEAGTANDKYMTPFRTAQAITTLVEKQADGGSSSIVFSQSDSYIEGGNA